MSQFYLTLPSNTTNLHRTSADGTDLVYSDPQQLLNHYRTSLPQRIRLEGDWEVALAEITYPHSWFNFNKGDAVLRVTTKQKNKKGESVPVHILCEIYPNQYNKADQLVGALNYNYEAALEEHVQHETIPAASVKELKVNFFYQRDL